MAVLSLTDASMWVAGYDLSGDSNTISLAPSVDELDVTTFGQGGFRRRVGGLRGVEMTADGFWQATVDGTGLTDLGVADRVVTISPTGQAASTAYMFQAGVFSYEFGGSVGEVMPFAVDAKNTDGLGMLRGQIAIPKGTVSATGAAGSALNLGAVGSPGFLYATVHVFTPGASITVVLESDDNPGFASATTQQTIGPLTTSGGTWVTRTAGPITDTHYRYRITAITGEFMLAAAIGST